MLDFPTYHRIIVGVTVFFFNCDMIPGPYELIFEVIRPSVIRSIGQTVSIVWEFIDETKFAV